ncbi:MAG: 5-(carboxyamino)imidazole ribonucleotide mutase [Planctomycetota bacterium]|nr:MAG: 5-(carboxyamino)imidazole ribonucleotide mutase [Planctomycetota bacterium]
MKKIAFVMGSDSDLDAHQGAFDVLKELEVPFEVRILSAHRTPKEACNFAETAAAEGFDVIVASAGLAAHLGGVLAAHTLLPVVGVPMAGGALQGVDALYSISQMPGGVPVASMGIGKAGAKNAALFAVRILSLLDEDLRKRLAAWIKSENDKVLAKDAAVRARFQ